MTDEQIKQNAEEYANSMYDKKYQCEPWKECYMIHNAGAHSRDEEIEMWKRVVEERQLEIEKLRNPWVSVEDRLPEKARGLYKLEEDEQHKMVLFKTANGRSYIGYLDAEEIWRVFTVPYKGAYPIDSVTWSRVTHWMPIPQIKKGE